MTASALSSISNSWTFLGGTWASGLAFGTCDGRPSRLYTYLSACFGLRHLGQINPVVALGVTQPILVSVGFATPCGCWPLLGNLFELFDRTVVVDFHVHRDPTVQVTLREHDVQVGHFDLDNPRDDLPSLLFLCYTQGRVSPASMEQVLDHRVEALPGLLAQLVKSVRLSEVNVIDRDARYGQCLISGVLRAGFGHQVVEVVVVASVLSLSSFISIIPYEDDDGNNNIPLSCC